MSCSCSLDVLQPKSSVPLQGRIKFEHFVNPLRIERYVNEKGRLRRGTFCPLDAHTNDHFALVLLANQRTSIVSLQENNGRLNSGAFFFKSTANVSSKCKNRYLRHTHLPQSFHQHISCCPLRPL